MLLVNRQTGEVEDVEYDPQEIADLLFARQPVDELARDWYNVYVLNEWKAAAAALKEAKELEWQWREHLTWLHGMTDRVGKLDLQYANQQTVRIERDANYTLDKSSALNDVLDTVPEAWQDIIKWTPSLHEPTYKKAPDEIKALFDSVLTTKPAAPSIEVSGDEIT